MTETADLGLFDEDSRHPAGLTQAGRSRTTARGSQQAGPASRRGALVVRLGLCAIALALCLAALLFGVFGREASIALFANSDTLLPANVAWELAHHDYAWANQQWPRIPSVPDILFFSLGEWVGLDWRITTLLYASFILIAGTLLMAWLAAIVGRRPWTVSLFWTGMAVTCALSLAVVASTDPATAAGWYLPIIAILPVTHGNALLLSFLALAASLGGLAGDRRQAFVVYVACLVGAFSDQLYFVYFLGPVIAAFVAASVLPAWFAKSGRRFTLAGAPTAATARAFLIRITFASVLGSLLQSLLRREARPEFQLSDFSPASVMEIATSTIWSMVCFAILTATVIIGLASLRRAFKQREVEFAPFFIASAGVISCVSSFGVLLTLHVDIDSYRYALPLLWWPLVFVVALGRWPMGLPAWIAALVAVGLVGAVVPLKRPALATWRSPLERCLRSNAARHDLRAGLATYGYSRQTMASSNWTFQVDQVKDDGSIYIWGNNEAAYRHDAFDPRKKPFYNFVVVYEGMAPGKLLARWGQPASRFACGDFDIWAYDRAISPGPPENAT